MKWFFLRPLPLLLVALIALGAANVRAGSYDDLMQASQRGDRETVEQLLNRGVDPDTSDREGNTLLMVAARDGRVEVIELLIARRARVSLQNSVGDTALLMAALKGHLPAVQRLVAAGAPLEAANGWTPLTYAAFEGRAAVARYLLDQGADVDAPAPNGHSALMLAARNGHLEVVQALLADGADTEIRTADGQTALELALSTGNTEIAQLIRNARAEALPGTGSVTVRVEVLAVPDEEKKPTQALAPPAPVKPSVSGEDFAR